MFDVIKKAEDERVKRAQEQARQQEDRARRERIRVAGLERLGQQETVVTPHSRWLGLVPFGAGQFQNGKETLGYVFLTSEALLAASTLLSLGVETHLVLTANQLVATGHKPDPSINVKLTNWKTALDYSSYAWLGVSIVGIVEAELTFVPEQRLLRKRPLPPELAPEHSSLRLAPIVGPVPGGGVLGVSGVF
jgi:hypothetical protein